MNGATRKKIFATIIVFFMFAWLAACSPGANEQGKARPVTLHLFTWSDYTEETVVKEFERRFGVKVVTDTFGSNEELLAKLQGDRKSTRLNSSHGYISYAVFCLKKKKKDQLIMTR